jgi:hypothetical protein
MSYFLRVPREHDWREVGGARHHQNRPCVREALATEVSTPVRGRWIKSIAFKRQTCIFWPPDETFDALSNKSAKQACHSAPPASFRHRPNGCTRERSS